MRQKCEPQAALPSRLPLGWVSLDSCMPALVCVAGGVSGDHAGIGGEEHSVEKTGDLKSAYANPK